MFNGSTATGTNWLVQIFATLFNIKYSNGVAEWNFSTAVPVNQCTDDICDFAFFFRPDYFKTIENL